MISSPGIGLQHLARKTSRSSWPFTTSGASPIPNMRLTVLTKVGLVSSISERAGCADSQHALNGPHQSGLGVVHIGTRRLRRFAQNFCEYLPRGIFSKPYRGVEILHFGETVVRCRLLQIVSIYFFQTAAKNARFFFKQPAADISGFFPLVEIDPVANFAFGVRGFYKTEPVTTGAVTFLGKNFDHVTAGNFLPQSHHLPVYFSSDTLVAYFGMNRISKINGSSASGQFKNTPLGSEGINLVRSQIHFQSGEEFARLLQFLRPFDQLPHPDDALIVVAGRLIVLVFPMSGHAFFSDAMHFLGADLHFKRLATVNHRGVQGLIQIGPRHRDVILEAAGHRTPDT